MKRKRLNKVSAIALVLFTAFLTTFIFFNIKNNLFPVEASNILTPTLVIDGDITENEPIAYASSIFIDSSNNSYVVDPNKSNVYKYDSAGVWQMTIGNGQLNTPQYVTVDSSGNIYIADTNNNSVLKFNSAGSLLLTISGNLSYPIGIAVDSSGNIYISDIGNNRIQKFDSSGTFVLTFGFGVQDGSTPVFQICTSDCFAGIDGSGEGQFSAPAGLAIYNSNLYVVDSSNNRIQEFTLEGSYVTQFGSAGSSDGQFDGIWGINFDDSGNIYVTDGGNSRIQKLTSAGVFVMKFGEWGESEGKLNAPQGVAVDSAGNIYVADSHSYIQKFTSAGVYASQYGDHMGTHSRFSDPLEVGIDSLRNIYVADTSHNRIQKFDSSGNFITMIGSKGTGEGEFSGPSGIFIDTNDNSVYVADTGNNRIQKFDSLGHFVFAFGWGVSDGATESLQVCTSGCYAGLLGTGSGQFAGVRKVVVDSDGNIYALDNTNSNVQKFTSAGLLDETFGSSGVINGFGNAMGLGVDSSGNIYVVDYSNNNIQKFTSVGTASGTYGGYGSGNGTFYHPYAIALDSRGNMYVTDHNNHAQVLNSSGGFITQFGSIGTANGYFEYPQGIAVDNHDNVYVADSQNNRVQKFVLPDRVYMSGSISINSGATTTSDSNVAITFDTSSATSASQMMICNVADFTGCTWESFTSPKSWILTSGYGVKTVYAKFKDSVGNESSVYSGSITFQETPPTHAMSIIGYDANADGKLLNPHGISVDASGNIYIADTDNNRIEKFNSSGGYVASFGESGTGNGQFDAPEGVFVDSSGYIYVADTGNNRIQKLDSSGAYVMQFGEYGSDLGQFNKPEGIFVDNVSGEIYVADTFNYRVQGFTSSGGTPILSFEAGYAHSVAVDSSGNIYVPDSWNNCIQIYNSGGIWSSSIYVGDYTSPEGVFVDSSGNIYVTDINYNRVRKFNSEGTLQWVVGSSGSELGQFDRPEGITIDNLGNVYVIEADNNRFQKLDLDGLNPAIFGSKGALKETFSYPEGVATDNNDNMYVLDTRNNRIHKYDSEGEYVMTFGEGGTGNGQFSYPQGIFVDNDGYIYVADSGNNRIQKFTSLGVWEMTIVGETENFSGEFSFPQGVAVDSSGNIYVADSDNNVIEKFNSNGVYLTQFGGAGADAGQLSSPGGVAVDSSNNIYVADSGNNRIQKFDSNGTYLMQFGEYGTGNGQFDSPQGVSVDNRNGNIYVIDTGNARVQKFNPLGVYITQFGKYTSCGGGGVLLFATIFGNNSECADGGFAWPGGISVDTNGNIYVADTDNNRVQKFTPSTSSELSPDSSLSALNISNCTLTPSFNSGTVNYSCSVASTVGTVNVTATTTSTAAGLKITGITATSGSPSTVNLQTGSNTIPIVVTAEDGVTTSTYSAVITKAAPLSSDSSLYSLNIPDCILSPSFSSDVKTYSCIVSSTKDSARITPTTSSPSASILINGIAGTSGVTLTRSLQTGRNTFAILVTAEDGTTSTYNIAISKTVAPALSSDSLISMLSISDCTLSPVFTSSVNSYTCTVKSVVNSVGVTVIPSFAGASFSINSIAAISGTPTNINLKTGTNLISIVVTAEDGVANSTYNVIVTKEASYVPEETVLNEITGETKNRVDLVSDTKGVLSTSISTVTNIVKTLPISEKASQNITAATLALVAVTPAVSIGLGSSYAIASMARLFSIFFAFFGLGKKKRNCGLVYDSVTKEPINNAVVRIYGTDGILIATEVTNAYGLFETAIESGQYNIKVQSNKHVFPSTLIMGAQDLPYENIYIGGDFNYDATSTISYSIPMDPLEKSFVTYGKTIAKNRLINLATLLLNLLMMEGLVFSLISYIKNTTTLNLVLLITYVLIVILGIIIRTQGKYKFGTVRDLAGNTCAKVQIGLIEADFNTIYAKRVTNEKGKYRFIVPGGNYKLVSLDPRYELVDSSDVISGKKRNKLMIVSKNIRVIRR